GLRSLACVARTQPARTLLLFFCTPRAPPRPTLFPYTTLFRSLLGLATGGRRPWRALVRGARAHPFVVAAVLVAALWLSRLCLAGARNGDSGYYHFPIMRWAADFPAVPGVVNLFPFLAYNQSFLLYATVVNVGPLAQEGHHVANGILVLVLLARCALGLARAVKTDGPGATVDLYYALLLPAA